MENEHAKFINTVKIITEQGGGCIGIDCDNCPASIQKNGYGKMCYDLWNNNNILKIEWFINWKKENSQPSEGIKYDNGKLKFNLIPAECEAMIAAVLTMGAIKYDDDNWKKIADIPQRYYNATARHLNLKRLGETFDNDSGLPHTAHAIVSLIFVLYKEIEEHIGSDNLMNFINEKLDLAIKKYGDKK